ncbi:MAG: hypothetical protein ACPG4T_00350 [Nannocystaceae bacterium]
MLAHVVLMAALAQVTATQAFAGETPSVRPDALLQTALHQERAWLATGDPQHAIEAAIFWEQRGDRALALDCLMHVERLGHLEPEVADSVAAAQARLYAKLVPVSVVVEPRSASGVEVSFERHGHRRARALDRPTTRGLRRSLVRVSLDPGTWTITAKAPGFEPVVRILEVKFQRRGEAITLNLLATPAEEVRSTPYTLLVQRSSTMPRAPISVTATLLDQSSPAVSCVIATNRDTCALEVERGPWQLAASAPAFVTTRMSVTLGDTAHRPVVVELVPESHSVGQSPLADSPQPNKHRLAHQTAIGMGISGLTGIGLAIVGQRHYNRQMELVRNDLNTGSCGAGNAAEQTCQARLIAPMRLRAAGYGLLGGAGGLAITSLALRFTRSKAVFIPLVVTSVSATIAAGVWLGVRTPQLDRAYSTLNLSPGNLGELDRTARERAYASMALGGGLGLLTGSVIGLVSRRPPRKTRASITTQPTGIAVSGQF